MIPNSIRADIAKLAPNVKAELVFAYLLLEDFRFSEISRAKLNREIKIAAQCVADDPQAAELLAASFGLAA
jgi:hypothetical protein